MLYDSGNFYLIIFFVNEMYVMYTWYED